jgi:hypothetical protein
MHGPTIVCQHLAASHIVKGYGFQTTGFSYRGEAFMTMVAIKACPKVTETV